MTSSGRFRRRGGQSSGSASSEAVRALAALLRAGSSPRAALIDWHREVPHELTPPLSQLSRRLLLGARIEEALTHLNASVGVEGAALAGIFAAHARRGGDIARMLDALVGQIERRGASLEAARAARAGAVLSARIVAGLPLLFLLFAPAGRASLFDGMGMMILAVGTSLAVGGILWIERLTPSPDALDDPAAIAGEVIAGVLDGGSGLSGALEIVSMNCSEPLRPAFRRARRLVRLGLAWPDALTMCGDEHLRSLASPVRRAEALGLPIARSLESWARSRRAAAMRDFEAALRRAPVLMVVPLTVFVLPSYILLGLAPFLRSF